MAVSAKQSLREEVKGGTLGLGMGNPPAPSVSKIAIYIMWVQQQYSHSITYNSIGYIGWYSLHTSHA